MAAASSESGGSCVTKTRRSGRPEEPMALLVSQHEAAVAHGRGLAEELRADLDRDACYRALRTRDPRFDGRFYTAVVSTGIYCRPICPAPIPKLENCVFLPSAAAAHQLGFRPCLRCRPEVAPGLAGWDGAARTVSRALHLIAEDGLGDDGVDELAERLGIGDRHLRRLFDRYVGASPIA